MHKRTEKRKKRVCEAELRLGDGASRPPISRVLSTAAKCPSLGQCPILLGRWRMRPPRTYQRTPLEQGPCAWLPNRDPMSYSACHIGPNIRRASPTWRLAAHGLRRRQKRDAPPKAKRNQRHRRPAVRRHQRLRRRPRRAPRAALVARSRAPLLTVEKFGAAPLASLPQLPMPRHSAAGWRCQSGRSGVAQAGRPTCFLINKHQKLLQKTMKVE
jgi:hypothetical protein